MPELPEVETIRSGLDAVLPGLVVSQIEVRETKQFHGDAQTLLGARMASVLRRGKLLVMMLDDGRAVTTHLKMTGQLIWKSPTSTVMGGHPSLSYVENLPSKHTRICIGFNDGSQLFFNDVRKFGYMELVSAQELAEHGFIGRLGPEPLESAFTREYLAERLRKAKKIQVKPWLLDQTNIAGIGNIYADESLFRAGVDPRRLANSLTDHEIALLHSAIQEVLELAISSGGSSERDYLNSVGEKGTYLQVAQVYHRTGQPCRTCGNPISRIKLGGRSTHFCSFCQH